MIRASDIGRGKIILILLTKVVTFYVGLTIVEFGEPSL